MSLFWTQAMFNAICHKHFVQTFDDETMKFGKKGLNYAPEPAKLPIDDICAEIETDIRHLRQDATQNVRRETIRIIRTARNESYTHRIEHGLSPKQRHALRPFRFSFIFNSFYLLILFSRSFVDVVSSVHHTQWELFLQLNLCI